MKPYWERATLENVQGNGAMLKGAQGLTGYHRDMDQNEEAKPDFWLFFQWMV